MGDFNIHVLGCGSALPTTRHLATSQVIDLRDKQYMIDCGEGTQVQMRNLRIRFNRLGHIFITHLHGDHCFGLPGLISTLGMEVLPMVGNPTSIRDLEEAGIRKTDLFVSVTPEETTNIASSILASKLGAHKTVARINNYEYLLPKNKELFEKMGINSMIYPEMLAAKEIVTAVKRPC